MSQESHERVRGLADGIWLVARTLVHVVLGGLALLTIATVVSVLGPMVAIDLYTPPVAAWWTVFTAVVVQAVPFLMLGTLVSAAIGAFVPERVFTRLLPRNPALAVPIAGAAGAVLPGCECASVPVADSLMRRGVTPAAALAFLLFPPPALGSYSAEREAAKYTEQGIGTFPALPEGGTVDLTLGQFTSRAIYDSGRTMNGRTLRMTGFVPKDGDTWYVTRLLISCCAADARPNKVEIRSADAPATDSWVTVTGTWIPKGKLGTDEAWPPVLDGTSVKQVEQPDNPYEKR